MPNLRGLPLRDALEICSLLELRCVAEGEGFVDSQILATAQGERVLKLLLQPPGVVALSETSASEEGAEGEPADGGGGEEEGDPSSADEEAEGGADAAQSGEDGGAEG